MDLRAAGLNEQPFPSHGKPPAVVTYRAQNKALQVLRETLEHPTGLSLLQGPALSGKSILIRNFLDSIDEEHGVAVVDGKGMNTTRLLGTALHQFGFDIDLSSNSELMGLLRVFAMQQAGAGQEEARGRAQHRGEQGGGRSLRRAERRDARLVLGETLGEEIGGPAQRFALPWHDAQCLTEPPRPTAHDRLGGSGGEALGESDETL